VLSAPIVIAELARRIGAPHRPIGSAYVSSLRLNCWIPRFDRSDGPLGACLKGQAIRPLSLSASFPGRRRSYRSDTSGVGAQAISVPPSRLNTYRLNASFVHALPPLNRQTPGRRPTAVPELKEWS
jgi:hypothetical protein